MLRRLLEMLRIVKRDVGATGMDIAQLKQRTRADLLRIEAEQQRNVQQVRAVEAEVEVYRKQAKKA